MRSSRGPRYPKHVLTGEREINPEILQAAHGDLRIYVPPRGVSGGRCIHLATCNSQSAMNYRWPADRAEGSRESLESRVYLSNNKLWYNGTLREFGKRNTMRWISNKSENKLDFGSFARENDSLILNHYAIYCSPFMHRVKVSRLLPRLWLLW